MFILVSECIIVHSWCICTYLDPCFSLFFFIYVCVRLYCHRLYVYRHISYSPFLSISLYLSFSVSGCIIGNFHVCEQARSARLVCKRSRKLMYDYYNSCVYMYVSCLLGSEFLFQSPDMLWLILCAYMSHDRVFVVVVVVCPWIYVVVFG